jgi:hypothetical protein
MELTRYLQRATEHNKRHAHKGLAAGCEPTTSVYKQSITLHIKANLVIQCVPLAGSPQKMLVYKKSKSAIHLHAIPVMECGYVL